VTRLAKLAAALIASLILAPPVVAQRYGNSGSFQNRINNGPEVGMLAPDFTLRTMDGRNEIRLSNYRGKCPVVLIFGSYT